MIDRACQDFQKKDNFMHVNFFLEQEWVVQGAIIVLAAFEEKVQIVFAPHFPDTWALCFFTLPKFLWVLFL